MDHSGIPLARHDIQPEDIAAVLEVLNSDRLSLGPRTEAFERTLAEAVGVQHAVAVNSGTSALHLLIRAFEMGPGDEIITTPFSFIASTNCILFERATPVFVDIDPETLCIDPSLVERAITPRTKAILAVDVFGHPAQLPALERIAKAHGVRLIEDSAESLGSSLNGQKCGSFGDAAIFGFYPNKQITTGEGGAIVTHDERVAEVCRSMADQGRGQDGWLHHVRLGYNFRIDEMSAALGLSQLARLPEIVAARARVADAYLGALADVEEIVLPKVAPAVGMSWFVFVVRLTNRFSRADRDRVLRELEHAGIGCRDYFEPIHLQPFIRKALGTGPGRFPVVERAGDRAIALPFYPTMTESDVKRVARALKGAVHRP
ncbi:MAG: DegT/DnrJ/EryC1/StrS family aminotransferase [Candidatus Bipolaricaulota bacterium]|nr:DegT/DnrJ/EryC1/StrS family aminotransferase [Candidatus Bipolaricaulota bacterium]